MPDVIPPIGSPVQYILPNGQSRTAFVLSERDGLLTLSVHKESASDFALPPNALGPDILAGHDAGSGTVTVASVRCGSGPGTWNALSAKGPPALAVTPARTAIPPAK